MKVIGVYNIKGGVGKTATSVNLGYLSAKAGYRTLIWDLDPQGASTYYFRVKAKVKGAKKLLRGDQAVDDVIKATDYEGLDLLPADFSYRNLDLMLDAQKKPVNRIHQMLKPLVGEYDRVFLDCPPSISLVSENVFRAAHVLLVPTIPTTLSLRTLEQLNGFLAGHEMERTPVWPLFSMADRRKKMHRDILAAPPQGSLTSVIPYASDVERMGDERTPVAVFAPNGSAWKAYVTVWQELDERLKQL